MFHPPCKDCTNRYLGCHDHCEAFKNAKDVYEQELEARSKEEPYKHYISGSMYQVRKDIAIRKKKQADYKRLRGH